MKHICLSNLRQLAKAQIFSNRCCEMGTKNSEDEAVGLTKVVPFLVEDELKAKGGHFSKTGNWEVHVVSDGLLITGQNPASSGPAAKVLLDRLAKPGKS